MPLFAALRRELKLPEPVPFVPRKTSPLPALLCSHQCTLPPDALPASRMDKRVRWLWLSVSLCWMMYVLVVLCQRSASPASGGPVVSGNGTRSNSGETAYHRNFNNGNTHPSSRQRGHRQDKTVVVVMPSPPMVSGPSTRIDRLQSIQDTWGQDLVDAGENRCESLGCPCTYNTCSR